MSLTQLTPELQHMIGTYVGSRPMRLREWVPNPFVYESFDEFAEKLADTLWDTPGMVDDVNDIYRSTSTYDEHNYPHFNVEVYRVLIDNLCENPHSVCMLESMVDRCSQWLYVLHRSWKLYVNPNASSLIVRMIEYIDRRRTENPLYWTHVEKKVWSLISGNPSLIHLLLENTHRINWCQFSTNPRAIPFLERHPKYIRWNELSKNPEAIGLLSTNLNCIHWKSLCENTNPGAMDLLRKNPEQIHGRSLSQNPSPAAIQLLREFPEHIDWFSLSGNASPDAIQLLREHPDCIVWDSASYNTLAMPLFMEHGRELSRNIYIMLSNTSPDAIAYMRQHPETFPFAFLTQNPGAIDYIEEQFKVLHPRDMLCSMLSLYKNPAIFVEQ